MAFVPISGTAVFDNAANPIEAAQLFAFDAGTSTPRTLYLTSALDPTKVHPTPVIASGPVLPIMFAGVGDYDIVILDPSGAQIRRLSNLPGDPAPSGGGTALDPLRQLPTGMLCPLHSIGRIAGFVRANGLTIGNGSSGATERGNDDCYALFSLLYQDPNLVVSGGRSPQGSDSDWAANKTIVLPDYQAYGLIGLPDMGNPTAAASRLNGGVIGALGLALGGDVGEAAHSLTGPELAPHAHGATLSIAAAGGFTPAGSISPIGDHSHNVTYNFQSAYGAGQGGAVVSVGNTPANSTGTTNAAGGHNHVFTGNAQPDHTHTGSVTIDNAGSGNAHNNLSPARFSTIYLKL